ncbi:hypothetical protein RDV84_13470 [Lysobacter yananisis]|uniref:Uncharacterized protein n=1 Tax=Lysobacter yananisis TaxID=1003114 RepID=A0ABY9P2H3_9GAMM|nr:hypothetical protein [Lysobacter yananisis]WMT01020.1 hypothetical protein RDV84_13470 [Lysobacter yananisis]
MKRLPPAVVPAKAGIHFDFAPAGPWKRRTKRCAALACALWPALSLATTQCPPEYGEKSLAFWALGWTVLGLFALLGLALPVVAVRSTLGRGGWLRAAWILLACLAMLGCWIAGLSIFGVYFVMVC